MCGRQNNASHPPQGCVHSNPPETCKYLMLHGQGGLGCRWN